MILYAKERLTARCGKKLPSWNYILSLDENSVTPVDTVTRWLDGWIFDASKIGRSCFWAGSSKKRDPSIYLFVIQFDERLSDFNHTSRRKATML